MFRETMPSNIAFLLQFHHTRKSNTTNVNRWSLALSFAFLWFPQVPAHRNEHGWRQYANIQIDSNNNLNTRLINTRWVHSLTTYDFEIIKKTEKEKWTVSQEVLLKRAWPDGLPGSANYSRHDPTASCTHAYSSYEQLDYHISWSPFRQHCRIREPDSQIVRQGVSPHSVDWGPVSF